VSDVVLGPSQPVCYIRNEQGVAAEQAVSYQKMRAGSGQLELKVETDGPTRLLRITDVEYPPKIRLLQHTFEENTCNTAPKCFIGVDLKYGLGISVIECNPREELMYLQLSK